MSDYCIVMAAFPSRRRADAAIQAVFDKQLCASAQAFGAQSHYLWEGEMHKDDDTIVLFATQKSHFSEIAHVLSMTTMTNYEQIISIDIEGSTEKYLKWIKMATEPRHRR